jgi:hypothetical protein
MRMYFAAVAPANPPPTTTTRGAAARAGRSPALVHTPAAPAQARFRNSRLETDIGSSLLVVGLARIFHQDADFRVVLGEPDRARPPQPIDHSIGKAGMPEMAGQNGPETA